MSSQLSSGFNNRGQLWGGTQKFPELSNLNMLERINRYIEKYSQKLEVQERCRSREVEIRALKHRFAQRNWNGITTTESFDFKINNLASEMLDDLPGELDVMKTSRMKRGLVNEFVESQKLSKLKRVKATLRKIQSATMLPVHKVRDI